MAKKKECRTSDILLELLNLLKQFTGGKNILILSRNLIIRQFERPN